MTTAKTRLTFDEVRGSVKRMQEEGERLVGRIRRDARSFVQRGPRATVNEALADVRRLRADVGERASSAIKDLEAQRTRVTEAVDHLRDRVVDAIVERLGVVTRSEFEELEARLARLERKVARRDEAA